MPDASKLRVFQEQEVHIAKTCGTCSFAEFPRSQSSWGRCKAGTYNHARHGPRYQPAHVIFTCPRWTLHTNLAGERELGDYAALVGVI